MVPKPYDRVTQVFHALRLLLVSLLALGIFVDRAIYIDRHIVNCVKEIGPCLALLDE